MNKILLFSVASAALLLCSCKSEFNAVYKSNDISYRYEYAKENYALHKYTRASILFGDMINVTKGTDNGEECLFLYGMSTFNTGDYESAAEIFKKYSQTYPKGKYAEMAYYFVGESLYKGSPEPRLDQSDTYSAIKSFQDFMDLYPFSSMKERAQSRMYELQDKLVEKELNNAKLYYNLGTYFGNCTSGGNNYEACIAEDECYGFINEYPDSKERSVAEKYIEKCKKITKNSKE